VGTDKLQHLQNSHGSKWWRGVFPFNPAGWPFFYMQIHRDFRLEEAVRTYSFWVFNLSFAFYAFYATAFTFHIVSLGGEFGFSKALLLRLFLPMAAISVFTNLTYGWINPWIRLKYLLVFLNVGAVLGAWGLLNLNGPHGVSAYVIGNGIASGGFVSLTGIVWPRFYGRLWLGAIGGLAMSTMVIASGAGPLVFGWVAQAWGTYRPVLLASLFVPVSLGILSFWADNPQRRMQIGD
jgi:MFS transporter, OFA family, oxalate/formate antiporter